MNNLIPRPAQNERLRLSWGVAVTDACNASNRIGMGGTLVSEGPNGSGAAPLPANQRNHRGQMAQHPFEVRWDASLEDGKGGWAIYLPNEHLLQVGSDFVVPTGATAIPDTDGWMELDEVGKDADHVWLNVTFNQTGPSSAALEAEDKTNATANIVGICIAEVSYEDDTESASVSQSVVGSIALPLSSGGGGSNPDMKSIEFNTSGALQIFGFASGTPALSGTLSSLLTGYWNDIKVPVRTSQGELKWLSVGYGMSSGGNTLTGAVSFVGDMKFDTTDHQLKKRVDSLDLATGAVTQGAWTMIEGGQAVDHGTI